MSPKQARWLLAASIVAFAIFTRLAWSHGLAQLDLGALLLPSPGYTRFALVWAVWCTLTVIPAAFAIAALAESRTKAGPSELGAQLSALFAKDRTWMVLGGILAFVFANWVQFLAMGSGRIVDDEPVYQFGAELLASGRLYAQSPEPNIFWERIFIVSDGKWYPQYFLGWPFLLVPGIWIGMPELMNPIYSGLTVPLLFLCTRKVAGSLAARVATVLFVASPMVVIAAASQMSHTTCLLFLTLTLYAFLRTRDDGSGPWLHALFALAFCVAFFIRPQTALPMGLPLLVVWLIEGLRARRSPSTFLAFGSVCLVMMAVFLSINHAQTGNALYPAMQRVIDHQLESGSFFPQFAIGTEVKAQNLTLDPWLGLLNSLSGIVRLNFDAYGWPISFLFVPFALMVRSTRVVWWMAITFLLAMLAVTDAGIDVFGPSHFFELILPMTVLSGAGFARLDEFARTNGRLFEGWGGIAGRFPRALVASLLVATLFGFTPVRIATARRVAQAAAAPSVAIEEAGISNAVLFGNIPHSPCMSRPTHSWVFWPPGNDPELSNDLLWVNHINTEDDRLFMERYFPEREGYWYHWTARCELALVSIDDPSADRVPPNPRLPSGYRVEFP